MNLKNKLANLKSKVSKKLLIALIGLLVFGGLTAIVKAEFYPNRTPFDYNKPCNPDDDNPYDRCGSLTGPVFNSFINTPSYGDERAFLDARRSDQTASGSYKNVLNDVTDGSREVVLRTYVHNNANTSTNESGLGVAKNAKVRVALPTAESQTLRARSYISADNANPALVEDTVDLVGGQDFKVEYIPGSAILYNNGPFKNGTQLNDSIVTTGAQIGYDNLNGNLPGCFDYVAVVQIRVRIIVKETSNLKFSKQVRLAGTKEWKKEVKAKPGDTVEWLLTTDAIGVAPQNNIIVRDVPAPNTELVPGSVKWIDAVQNAVQNDKPLFDGGINVGNYANGGGFYIMFSSKINGDFKECEVRVRNLAYVKSDSTSEIGDDADVVITKDKCEKPEEKKPVYSCDLVTLEDLGGRKVKATVKATALNGARVKNYVYDFGDGSDKLVTDKTSAEHTFAKDGSFVVRVAVNVNANGKDQLVESDKCAAPIKFEANKPPVVKPPVQPETPKELPNTGAGDVFGIVAAVTVAGAIAHRLILSRQS